MLDQAIYAYSYMLGFLCATLLYAFAIYLVWFGLYLAYAKLRSRKPRHWNGRKARQGVGDHEQRMGPGRR